ncbi:MAG TPA: GH1 family beta-glucosidase [Catenuloplanes sp.]
MSPLTRRTLLAAALGGVGASAAGCSSPGSGTRSEQTAAAGSATAAADPAPLRFPDGFTWGAATSAYQVEGAANTDGRGRSIWDTFSHQAGNVHDGSNGDVSTDHYHRLTADLDLMKSLGLRGYRFSVSWPRVLPTGRGTVNQRGLDFYKRLVDGLHKRGIAPALTLFHWDLPQPLQDAGGWENRDCAKWFADYAAVVYGALGSAVPTWITINEPKTIVQQGYQSGIHAPGKKLTAGNEYVVAHHLLLGHGLAVQAFRAAGTGQRIGPALNLLPVYLADPADKGEHSQRIRAFVDILENRLYLDPILKGGYPGDFHEFVKTAPAVGKAIHAGDEKIISSPVDLVGVQYYGPMHVDKEGMPVTKLPTSDAPWQQIHPDGLYELLIRLKRDYGDVPLVITENGRPTTDQLRDDAVDDAQRIAFLREHLRAAHRAVTEGVRLTGFYVWSLLDNFEWAEGYRQRWGMVYVDYTTLRRVPKNSAKWYAQVIARNSL